MTFEVTGSAVIPTGQYQNVQPSFTCTGETMDEARKNWLREMWKFHRMLGVKFDVSVIEDTVTPQNLKVLKCWASGYEVSFDPEAHHYIPTGDSPWLSGSAFADKFISAFNDELVAGKCATKYGVAATDILDMWGLNAYVSRTLGSALHGALQLRGEYAELSRAMKDGKLDAALTKNPILRPIVEAFFTDERDLEVAAYEAFVADPELGHCGQIDRLVIDPDGGVYVEDFKTNTDLSKRETIKAPFKGVVESTQLGAYWLQLSFYARILESQGKTVKGLRIHHWVGDKWVTYSSNAVDITDAVLSLGS